MMRLILAGAVTLAAIGCGSSVGPGDAQGTSREVGDSLTIDVAISRSTIAPSDTVTISVSVTNRFPRPMTVGFGNACQIYFIVQRTTGEPIEPESGGPICARIITTIELRAGETTTRTFVWKAARWSSTPRGWTPLPAGEYRVAGALNYVELFTPPRSGWMPLTIRTPARQS